MQAVDALLVDGRVLGPGVDLDLDREVAVAVGDQRALDHRLREVPQELAEARAAQLAERAQVVQRLARQGVLVEAPADVGVQPHPGAAQDLLEELAFGRRGGGRRDTRDGRIDHASILPRQPRAAPVIPGHGTIAALRLFPFPCLLGTGPSGPQAPCAPSRFPISISICRPNWWHNTRPPNAPPPVCSTAQAPPRPTASSKRCPRCCARVTCWSSTTRAWSRRACSARSRPAASSNCWSSACCRATRWSRT
ncbi:hypothetical protein D9M69_526100 [compost metagenome]